MSALYRWVVDAALSIRENLDYGTRVKPTTIAEIPDDIIVNICEWLCVRDILALRMTNKGLAVRTRNPAIWFFLLRRLTVPLPILPAASRYRFGNVSPLMYERLMRRALYLEKNWRRLNPYGSHSYFETYGHTIGIKMIPGGKYMLSVTKNPDMEKYLLVLWDLDHAGVRVALVGAHSDTPFLMLEVVYALVDNHACVVFAFAASQKQCGDSRTSKSTQVQVVCIPIKTLEELAENSSVHGPLVPSLLERPFHVLHESTSSCEINQLALAHTNAGLVLLALYRPHTLVFHYLETNQRSDLILGPIHPYNQLRYAIWAVKVIPGQNEVLIARVMIDRADTSRDITFLALEMHAVPGPGVRIRHPKHIGVQLLNGLNVDGIHFSNREVPFFTSLHDPEGSLPAPANRTPPPISIFLTTKKPRGFVHCLLSAGPVPGVKPEFPYRRGSTAYHKYVLPASPVERQMWSDKYARPIILPGAYRSFVFMRPHISPRLLNPETAKPPRMPIIRFCTHTTKLEECQNFATPRTEVRSCTEAYADDDAMLVDEPIGNQSAPKLDVERLPQSLSIPRITPKLMFGMMKGLTASAFDESTGKLCIATMADTDIHMVDFGGPNWEAAVIKR